MRAVRAQPRAAVPPGTCGVCECRRIRRGCLCRGVHVLERRRRRRLTTYAHVAPSGAQVCCKPVRVVSENLEHILGPRKCVYMQDANSPCSTSADWRPRVGPRGPRPWSIYSRFGTRRAGMLRVAADWRQVAWVVLYFWATWLAWVDVGVWLLPVLMYLSFAGATIAHNSMHVRVFSSRAAEAAWRCAVSLVYGHPVNTFVSGHNKSHHAHMETAADPMHTPPAVAPSTALATSAASFASASLALVRAMAPLPSGTETLPSFAGLADRPTAGWGDSIGFAMGASTAAASPPPF